MYNCGYRTRAPDTRVFIETCATFHQFPYGTLYDRPPLKYNDKLRIKKSGQVSSRKQVVIKCMGGGGVISDSILLENLVE